MGVIGGERNRLRQAVVVAFGGALAALLLAAPAQAATAKVEKVGWLSYIAAPGESNSVSVSFPLGAQTAIIKDPGARIRPGQGCVPLGSSQVLCAAILSNSRRSLESTFRFLSATLNDRNDRFAGAGAELQVVAGPGDDVVTTGGRNDSLNGGPGDDRLRGMAGFDQLFPGSGADDVSGGAGSTGNTRDVAYYGWFTSQGDLDVPRTVSLDDVANDGGPGENDNIRSDVEGVVVNHSVFSSPNVLIGNGGDNTFFGGDGNDVIRGLGGSDVLWGWGGDDDLDGGSGADEFNGGLGDDLLQGRDGESDLGFDCHAGVDLLVADLIDPPATNCEQEDRG